LEKAQSVFRWRRRARRTLNHGNRSRRCHRRRRQTIVCLADCECRDPPGFETPLFFSGCGVESEKIPAFTISKAYNRLPPFADGIVYFGCRDSKFYALDAATGKQLWPSPTRAPGSSLLLPSATAKSTSQLPTPASFMPSDAKTGAPVFSLDFKHWPMFSSPPSPAISRTSAPRRPPSRHQSQNPKARLVLRHRTAENKTLRTTPRTTALPNTKAAYISIFSNDDVIYGGQKMLSVGAVLSFSTVFRQHSPLRLNRRTLYALPVTTIAP